MASERYSYYTIIHICSGINIKPECCFRAMKRRSPHAVAIYCNICTRTSRKYISVWYDIRMDGFNRRAHTPSNSSTDTRVPHHRTSLGFSVFANTWQIAQAYVPDMFFFSRLHEIDIKHATCMNVILLSLGRHNNRLMRTTDNDHPI